MGLDTTHDCWHGSYGSFMLWRKKLANVVGIPLEEMSGYKSNEPIEWDTLPPDKPLHFLLKHSDCDGNIPIEMLLPLAKRLDELAFLFDETDEDYKWLIIKTLQFSAGLKLAAILKERVEFR